MKKLILCALVCAAGSLFAATKKMSQMYVQSGLVGQWDAIENAGIGQHADVLTEWVDLTGQTGNFTLNANITTIEGSAILKKESGVAGYIDSTQRRTEIRTIEAVVSSAPESGWIAAVFVSQDQTVSINKDHNGHPCAFFDNFHFGRADFNVTPLMTIAGLYQSSTYATDCYQNGSQMAGTSFMTSWSKDPGVISMGGVEGIPNATNPKDYRIHAIRFYTRALTSEELAWNALLDKLRFPSGEVGTISKHALTDDGSAEVSVQVETCDGSAPCALSATVRDLVEGTMSEQELGTATDSNPHVYAFPRLLFGHRYEIAIRGTWRFSDEQTFEKELGSVTACVCDSGRYAQDGLVGQWDAIENAGIGLHADAILSWSDLTGKTGDFVLDTDIATVEGSAILKKESGVAGYIDSTQRRTDIRTIEAVVSSFPESGWVAAVFVSTNQTVSINRHHTNTSCVFLDYGNYGKKDFTITPLMTITGLYKSSTSATNCYQNGSRMAGTSYASYWSKDPGVISMGGVEGIPNATNPKDYRIHAIRFYTRELTPAEIDRHAFIDQLRFSPGGFASATCSAAGVGKVNVSVTANTLDGTATCKPFVIVRDYTAGTITTNEQAEISSSEPQVYSIDVNAGNRYDVVVHGVWTRIADGLTFASDVKVETGSRTAAQQYVQDGLVGQWDAIENVGIGQHADSIAKWIDLTGQTGDFTLNKGITTIEGSAIRKTGQGCAGYIDSTERRTDIKTIEAVVSSLPDSGWAAPVLISQNQGVSVTRSYQSSTSAKICTGMFLDYRIWGRDNIEITPLMTLAGLFKSDTAATNAYQNGAMVTGDAAVISWSVNPTKISLGGIAGDVNDMRANSVFGYRIHAIRFYTRELTRGELAWNAFLDQCRFTGNCLAEVSRTAIDANGEMKVSVAMNMPDGTASCKLVAVARDRITGLQSQVLEQLVPDSAEHVYAIQGLDPSHGFEIVVRGEWTLADGSKHQYDLKVFDVSPEADARAGRVYQTAAVASGGNPFDWVVSGSGLRRSPKAGDLVYVGQTNGAYRLQLSGAKDSLEGLQTFGGAGVNGVKTQVEVQEGAVVSTHDGFAVGTAKANMTATGELRVSGGSLTAGGRGLVCGGGDQLVVVSGGKLSAPRLSVADSASVARFRIIGSAADILIDTVDPAIAATGEDPRATPVFWDYRFDTTAVPGGPGLAPRKMSASDATVHGHFRVIPFGGFQLASTNVFPLVVHTDGTKTLVASTADGAKYDGLCTDLWDYRMGGPVLSAVLNESAALVDGQSYAEGRVRGFLQLPRVANPKHCLGATVRMLVEPRGEKTLDDIVAGIREQYPDTTKVEGDANCNVRIPLPLGHLRRGTSNWVVFDFSSYAKFADIERGTVTTNAVVKWISAEVKKPGLCILVGSAF